MGFKQLFTKEIKNDAKSAVYGTENVIIHSNEKTQQNESENQACGLQSLFELVQF